MEHLTPHELLDGLRTTIAELEQGETQPALERLTGLTDRFEALVTGGQINCYTVAARPDPNAN